MPSPGEELSSLDFSSLIGGSLNAVVTAQAQSARTSVDFIKEVGFEQEQDGKIGKPVYVSFTYPKQISAAEGTTPATFQDMNLKVPILTMMPIPFIRVAEATIDFNVKINSVSSTENSTDKNLKGELKGSASVGIGPFKAHVSVKASVSNQKKSSSSEKVEKDYSLHINVRAVQDDMPAGIDRILDILETSIQSVAVGVGNNSGAQNGQAAA